MVISIRITVEISESGVSFATKIQKNFQYRQRKLRYKPVYIKIRFNSGMKKKIRVNSNAGRLYRDTSAL